MIGFMEFDAQDPGEPEEKALQPAPKADNAMEEKAPLAPAAPGFKSEEDPRLQSGIPQSLGSDDEAFVRMAGLVRRRLEYASAPAGQEAFGRETSALSFFQTGVADVDPDAAPPALEPRAEAAGAAPHAEALVRQRMEGSTRLMEAEQLLQALERQPREVEPEPAPPLRPAPAVPARERRRRYVFGALLRLSVVAAAFAVASWFSLGYLMRLLQEPVRPENLEQVPSFQVEPAPRPGAKAQETQEPAPPAPDEPPGVPTYTTPEERTVEEITVPLLQPLQEPDVTPQDDETSSVDLLPKSLD